MAIRKFRKHMKPVIWVITILFVMSSLIFTALGVRNSYIGKNKSYALKLGKNEISRLEVERLISNRTMEYSRILNERLDKELIRMIALNDIIDRNLLLQIAKDLSVKVTNKELNTKYTAIEKSFGSKEQFKRALLSQGLSRETFKKELEKELLLEKTIQKVQDGIIVDDKEVEEFFNDNKSHFLGKNLDEVKNDIVTVLTQKKTNEAIYILLENKRDNVAVKNVSSEYVEYLPKVMIEKEGLEITNVDIAKKTLNNLFADRITEEEAKEKSISEYNKAIKMIEDAKKNGILVEENYPTDYKIIKYREKFAKSLKSKKEVTEKELREYFEKNKAKYDTQPSSEVKILVMKIEPSEEDKAEARKKAKDILKELTVDNFKEKAKEYSEGPSASNGGELGWFSKEEMVEPFQKAVFSGKVGEIYPEPVETIFGEHLIYIEDRDDKENKAKASHILITIEKSKETKEAKLEEIKKLIPGLKDGTKTFDEIANSRKDILKNNIYTISEDGYIPGLGYNQELANKLLSEKLGTIDVILNGDNVCLYNKIKDVKYKKASFADVKELVKSDFISEYVDMEMKQYQ